MKLVRLLANLGYGSRKEVAIAIRDGRVTGESESLRFDGEPIDPPHGLVIVMNKPAGYTCSHADQGPLVYDLLAPRYLKRDPKFSSVGRLDAETTGAFVVDAGREVEFGLAGGCVVRGEPREEEP
jgi:16S rRNA pseudouridine516 synthase